MTDEHTVPKSADGYLPTVIGFKDAKVDTADPRYKAATAAAHKAGLTQHQFSHLLAHEAERVIASQAKPAPATKPAETPAAASRKIEGYANMSFAEKLAAAGHV